MWKPGSHSACSTNWKLPLAGSNRIQIAIERARTMSDVQSAIHRAFRATNSSSPRKIIISATPTSGRKVTSVRRGQCDMLILAPEQIPGDEHHHADQHGEGIVIDETGLQSAGPHREIDRRGGKAVWSKPVDHRAVALLPQ